MYWALCLSSRERRRTRTSTRPHPLHSAAPCPYTFGGHLQKTYLWKHQLVPLLLTIRSVRLAHTAGHLQLDQAVQLNRVLHREFLGDRLDEAVDDQRVGLGLIRPTAHQVGELVVTDLRDGRFVADFGLVLFDANGWIGIGASMLIEQECVTADMGLGVVRTPVDADQAAIRGSTIPFGDRLRENLVSGVRSKVRDLGSSVQLHPIAGECD